MIIMNQEEAQLVSQIYNTFFSVRTYGQDTINMGKALEAFQQILSKIEICEEGEEQEGT